MEAPKTSGRMILRGVRAQEMRIVAQIEGKVELHLAHEYSYSVSYAKETQGPEGPVGHCRGEFHAKLKDKTLADKFFIDAVIVGYFDYTGDLAAAPKEQIHVLTYKELFPHARAIIRSASALCGYPPFLIPDVDIGRQEIISFDMGGRPQ